MLTRKQTKDEREAIKKTIVNRGIVTEPEIVATVVRLDDESVFKEKKTGKEFKCIEVQLLGALIEAGVRRRYVSYKDLGKYEVSY